jgi:hypothetical protein
VARCPRCPLSRFWLIHCPFRPLASFGRLISHNDMVVDEYGLDPVPCSALHTSLLPQTRPICKNLRSQMSISSDSDTKWTPLMFPCVVWWSPGWSIGSSQLCCTFSVWLCECAPSWCSLNSGIGMLHIFLTGVCSETLSNSKTILCPLNVLVVFFTSSVCTSQLPSHSSKHWCTLLQKWFGVGMSELWKWFTDAHIQLHPLIEQIMGHIFSWQVCTSCIRDDTWVSACWKRAFFFTCVFQGVAFVIFRMIDFECAYSFAVWCLPREAALLPACVAS